ncbi:hypothetical protein [Serinicoccus kebangsaanensis]|uniref:hypothetical protein n=1 Tax=Serinicoccus kebangsaanensis TaxID=2602069 RepID=UPI00124E39A5|nr:hypothetical protein [Serinicoccus kebangsaanensis]
MVSATGSLVAAIGAFGYADEPDPSDPPCGGIQCDNEGDGSEVGLTHEEVRAISNQWPPGANPESATSWYEYQAVIDCRPPNTVNQPRLEICQAALDACAGVADPAFALAVIYRRTVSADGDVLEGWAPGDSTCFSDSVPPRSGETVEELTEAMIIEQFHQTDFALPEAVIQPPEGRTLVNLPVYFELAWPADGFEPQEVDTTTLIGHEVRIRPTLIGATYVTGDGASIGPTDSLGGPYPEGDITHEYTDAADVAPYISVEYGGEVSVNGGDWSEIPSTVVIDGPTSPLEVLTSKNRLYSN